MLGVSLAAVALAASPAPWVVVAAARPESAGSAVAVAPLAQALIDDGLPVLSGLRLRRQLLPADARPLVRDVPPDAESALVQAQTAYDAAEFADCAQRAEVAAGGLEQAPPSARREVLDREAQVLWGAALLQLKGQAAARPHFRAALARNLQLIDEARFAPPVQRLFEEERELTDGLPKVKLTVAAPAGGTVYIDGSPRGEPPLVADLAPHRATVWVELGGAQSWAHPVDLRRAQTIDIDAPLEVAAREHDGELWLQEPVAASAVAALAAHAEAAMVVLLSERDGALAVERYLPDGRLAQQLAAPAAQTDWAALAAEVTAVPRTDVLAAAPAPAVAAIATAPAEPTPVATVHAHRGFPWWGIALIAAGTLAVAGAVTLAALPSTHGEAMLGQPSPAGP